MRRELPANFAVPILVLVYAEGIDATSLIVVASELSLAEVDVTLLDPVVKLNGEHPTKFGAVELTAAHS